MTTVRGRDCKPWEPIFTLHSNTLSSALQMLWATNPFAVTTIAAPSSSSVGIITCTLPTPEVTITTTITETYTVTLGPTEPLPPFTLVTPLPACSTVLVQDSCGQEACFHRLALPVAVYSVTKKTPMPTPHLGDLSSERPSHSLRQRTRTSRTRDRRRRIAAKRGKMKRTRRMNRNKTTENITTTTLTKKTPPGSSVLTRY